MMETPYLAAEGRYEKMEDRRPAALVSCFRPFLRG